MNDILNIQNSLFDAMGIFMRSAEENTRAARVLECRIYEILDSSIGKYRVSYLENTFIAHSINKEIYSINENVYVLIPDNNFAKEKVILGNVYAKKREETNETTLEFNEEGIGTLVFSS